MPAAAAKFPALQAAMQGAQQMYQQQQQGGQGGYVPPPGSAANFPTGPQGAPDFAAAMQPAARNMEQAYGAYPQGPQNLRDLMSQNPAMQPVMNQALNAGRGTLQNVFGRQMPQQSVQEQFSPQSMMNMNPGLMQAIMARIYGGRM